MLVGRLMRFLLDFHNGTFPFYCCCFVYLFASMCYVVLYSVCVCSFFCAWTVITIEFITKRREIEFSLSLIEIYFRKRNETKREKQKTDLKVSTTTTKLDASLLKSSNFGQSITSERTTLVHIFLYLNNCALMWLCCGV